MSAEKTIFVSLFLGEQDGYETETTTVNGVFPSLLFVHRRCDDARFADAERQYADDPETLQLFKDALSVLAYEFTKADPRDGVTGGKQYTYTRLPSHDRQLTDPAV